MQKLYYVMVSPAYRNNMNTAVDQFFRRAMVDYSSILLQDLLLIFCDNIHFLPPCPTLHRQNVINAKSLQQIKAILSRLIALVMNYFAAKCFVRRKSICQV